MKAYGVTCEFKTTGFALFETSTIEKVPALISPAYSLLLRTIPS